MQSRTTNTLALSASVLLVACIPGEEALEHYEKFADSRTTTATDDVDEPEGPWPATTGDSDAGATTNEDPEDPPDTTTTGADPALEILNFTIDPPVIDDAGPVSITASFSPRVHTAVLFEKHDGESRVLEVLDPIDTLAHEYAVTSDALNGVHEVYLQAFDADGELVQAIDAFDVALPPGGTQVWHHVDYDPDDKAVYAYGADVTAHGDGVVVVGARWVQQQIQIVVRRYTANNELDWAFDPDEEVVGAAVEIDADGNVIIVGETAGAKPRMWLHKLDADGMPLWNQARTGVPDTRGFDVAVNAEGLIYVAGARTVTDPDDELKHEDDAVVWEFAPDGAMKGSAIFDNNDSTDWGDDRAHGIAVLADGRVVLAGETTAKNGNNELVPRAIVLEYAQSTLDIAWIDVGLSAWASTAHAITDGGNGGVVLAGWTQQSQIKPRRLVVRRLVGFDEANAASWEYPGYPAENSIGEAYAIARDPEGRFAIGARIETEQTGDAHVFLARPYGWPGWFPPFTYSGSEDGNEAIYGVATDRFGYVHYTGTEIVDGTARLMLGTLNP